MSKLSAKVFFFFFFFLKSTTPLRHSVDYTVSSIALTSFIRVLVEY